MAENTKTFDNLEPKKSITDPLNLGANPQFPAHVHKWAGRDEKGNVLQNHYKVVQNEDEQRAAVKDGWSVKPVHEEPTAKKDK